MNAQTILKTTLKITNMAMHSYLGDLTDADLLTRPGEGCNHIAWQLGHLIASNTQMLEGVAPGLAPKLPEGFDKSYSKEMTGVNDPARLHTKQEYLDMFAALDAATIAALDKTTEADLDKPAPEFLREWFPTVGDVYVLIVSHSLMHAGQWVPVRRKLGKPIVI